MLGLKKIISGGGVNSREGGYYFNARYYDPTIGRFITEDPARDGINWYVYCGNNPLSYTDPTGLVYNGCGTGDLKSGTVLPADAGDFTEAQQAAREKIREHNNPANSGGGSSGSAGTNQSIFEKWLSNTLKSQLGKGLWMAINMDYGKDFYKNAWLAANEGDLEGYLKAILSVASGGMESAYDAEIAAIVKSGKLLTNAGQALLELARLAKQANSSIADAKVLMQWAQEYGIEWHGPEEHDKVPWHFHIGPVDHIFLEKAQ